jgi:DNA-binding NarL/FixJ family response regulator
MRVLLADDQAWLRSALRLLLEHQTNVEVVGETGNVRMLPLYVNHLHPDLLFLDWQLPELDTNNARQQLLTSLRSIDPNLYIIALTNDENIRSCLLLGADAFVNKAEPPEKILAVLRLAASKKPTPGSQVAGGHSLL